MPAHSPSRLPAITATKAANSRCAQIAMPRGSSLRSERPRNSAAATYAVAIHITALCRCQVRIRLLGKMFSSWKP
ncbi:hypothetical protein RLIN73S_04183 [Rhodanobacter lindaniclasticus]